ncbi:MAG: glycosyltransferase [Methylomonas sp.]|nr:glycosyltransferase [Methylomonas sp.]PPD22108.1 MAG: glycosyl transferase [Methylomonas sp.]PPD42405.1 MAG: glycosyl transferase [Methylomonas sp.]PPD53115.1 MAG: glycosyl transferase [Methylomonas sp.]
MSSASPLISVIMPCYNAANVIEKTVANLFKQTLKDFELIIIDDGSTDNSIHILKKISKTYPSVIIFQQHNQGPGSARNRGIKTASGKFIAFLDADDSWEPAFLYKLHSALSNSPDCVLAYCGWQNIGLEPNQCKPYIPPDYEQSNKLALLLDNCPWPIHAALTYKTSIEKVGGFSEKWLTAEDFDMWLRITIFEKIVRVPEVLAYYHHQEQTNQISKLRLRAILNHWEVQTAFINNFGDASKTLTKKKANEIINNRLLHSAYECYWANDLYAAHILFRKIINLDLLNFRNFRYILPSLLPYPLYRIIVNRLRS